MNAEKYIDILVKENSLHDSNLIGISLENECFELEFNCEGMGLSYYDQDLKDIYITIKLDGVKKLKFDFIEGIIDVLSCTIKEENGVVSLTVNDNEVEVVAKKIEYGVRIINKHGNELLDKYLKENL